MPSRRTLSLILMHNLKNLLDVTKIKIQQQQRLGVRAMHHVRHVGMELRQRPRLIVLAAQMRPLLLLRQLEETLELVQQRQQPEVAEQQLVEVEAQQSPLDAILPQQTQHQKRIAPVMQHARHADIVPLQPQLLTVLLVRRPDIRSPRRLVKSMENVLLHQLQ